MDISSDFKSITLVGGEPIFFTFQPCRADKTPEPNLDRRHYVFMIYSKTDGLKKIYDGAYRVTARGPLYEWNIEGRVSKALEGRTDVKYFIGQRINNGIDPVTNNGSLIIEEGPPYDFDDDDAPYSMYLWHVRRENDPLDRHTNPKYSIEPVEYDGVLIDTPVEPPVAPSYSPFDFSLTDDTMMAFAAM